jgi:hypothetical protein
MNNCLKCSESDPGDCIACPSNYFLGKEDG